ncbi:MAG TPA: hypothetical protein VI893_08255 [Thermoplasmata archaeon]|nr:hypothetical protein [Thermoplasmata archaeon]
MSLPAETDRKLRGMAERKFGGRKGAISKVIVELVDSAAEATEQDEINSRAIETLMRGLPLGLRGRKISRDEMHER